MAARNLVKDIDLEDKRLVEGNRLVKDIDLVVPYLVVRILVAFVEAFQVELGHIHRFYHHHHDRLAPSKVVGTYQVVHILEVAYLVEDSRLVVHNLLLVDNHLVDHSLLVVDMEMMVHHHDVRRQSPLR
jgi:hypothetical protein